METLEALGLARRLWPRLIAVLVVAGLCFAPQPSAAVLMQAGEEKARQITSILDRVVRSAMADSDRHREGP